MNFGVDPETILKLDDVVVIELGLGERVALEQSAVTVTVINELSRVCPPVVKVDLILNLITFAEDT